LLVQEAENGECPFTGLVHYSKSYFQTIFLTGYERLKWIQLTILPTQKATLYLSIMAKQANILQTSQWSMQSEFLDEKCVLFVPRA
jgi:hypothetical protein